jgi:hypothetical protein
MTWLGDNGQRYNEGEPLNWLAEESMPVHDWSHVDANLFHHFHQAWTMNISNALNGGLLPPGYSALVEQHAGAPDVLTLERRSHPRSPSGRTGGAVLEAPPPPDWQVMRSATELSAVRANRITIRHSLGRVVCVMEIVSPGNKSSRAALRQFVEKTVEFLRAGVHVLVVDLFPVSIRDPQGIHKTIWDEIEEQPFQLPPEKPLTLAAYVAAAVNTAYVHPVGVGDVLPDMPAWGSMKTATYRCRWKRPIKRPGQVARPICATRSSGDCHSTRNRVEQRRFIHDCRHRWPSSGNCWIDRSRKVPRGAVRYALGPVPPAGFVRADV